MHIYTYTHTHTHCSAQPPDSPPPDPTVMYGSFPNGVSESRPRWARGR